MLTQILRLCGYVSTTLSTQTAPRCTDTDAQSPFRGDSRQELIDETTRAKVEFHEKYWGKVSDQAKGEFYDTMPASVAYPVLCIAFILALIKADPAARLTAEEALRHPVRV